MLGDKIKIELDLQFVAPRLTGQLAVAEPTTRPDAAGPGGAGPRRAPGDAAGTGVPQARPASRAGAAPREGAGRCRCGAAPRRRRRTRRRRSSWPPSASSVGRLGESTRSVSARRAQRSRMEEPVGERDGIVVRAARWSHSHWRRTGSGTSRSRLSGRSQTPSRRSAKWSRRIASRSPARVDASRRVRDDDRDAPVTAPRPHARRQARLLPGLASGEPAGQPVDAVGARRSRPSPSSGAAPPGPSPRRSRTARTSARDRRPGACGRPAAEQQAGHHRTGRERPFEQRFRRPVGDRSDDIT